LLGQDGDVVWLLIGNAPMALSAHDGQVVVDAAVIEQRNPALKGLLPSEAKYYSFDRGLVLMTADARRLVIRGDAFKATDYVPTPAPLPEPDRYANGRERTAPILPYGEVPARQVTLDGQWLGLYTAAEAAEASNDQYGDRLRYPHSVTNEGSKARRTFWRGKIGQVQSFEDKFLRLDALQPIAGAPVFLKGSFVKDPANGDPMLMQAPEGVLVWSITRIDQAGRLALTRLATDLNTMWKSELPLSEEGTGNVVSVWLLPGRLVAMGEEVSDVDGVTRSDQHLVSVDLASGQWQGWDMPGGRALYIQ
ncbi:MAG: PA2928 family protein, partial [Thermomonas sp.]